MSFILVLAEKPNQARSLADALLGTQKSQRGYIEGLLPDGRTARITAFNGHCVGHADPQEYGSDWGSPWRLETLPVVPPEGSWKFKPIQPDVLARIDGLWRNSIEIVNACDAGREGEFIFWSSMRSLGWEPKAKPTTRLWVMDPSPKGILAAWNSRLSATDKKLMRLVQSAHTRWQADYIFGVNLSRYVTLTLPAYGTVGRPTYSIGRVKTPTLALVQNRIDEVERFVSEKFFVLKCEFASDKGNYFATVLAPPNMRFRFDDTRFRSYDGMNSIRTEVAKNPNDWSVFDNREEKEENPPAPFDSLELMRCACRLLGWAPRRTMRAAQELYDRDGAITYPRTESQLIPPGLLSECSRVFEELWPFFEKNPYPKLAAIGRMPVSSTYFQEDKNDFLGHHAIIPTGIVPAQVGDRGSVRDAWVLWDLIARRFVTALCPPAIVMASSRILELAIPESELNVRAITKAAPVLIPNWLLVEDALGNSGGRADSYAKRQLIEFPESAATAKCVQTHSHEGNTTASPYYTEDELLYSMKELRLGTAATRAEIIDDLYEQKYLERKDNGHLFTTGLGAYHLEMIRLAGAGEVAEPGLTAAWEDYFAKLESGQKGVAAPAEFVAGVVREVTNLGLALQKRASEEQTVRCPETFRIVGEDVTGGVPCYRFHGKYSRILFPKRYFGRQMTAANWRDIIVGGRSGFGPFRFTSPKTGVTFAAKVVVNLRKKTAVLVFSKNKFGGQQIIE